MGQAKNRGTYEERKAIAIEKNGGSYEDLTFLKKYDDDEISINYDYSCIVDKDTGEHMFGYQLYNNC